MILHPESFWNFKKREGRDMWLVTQGCLLSQPPINPLPRFFRSQKNGLWMKTVNWSPRANRLPLSLACLVVPHRWTPAWLLPHSIHTSASAKRRKLYLLEPPWGAVSQCASSVCTTAPPPSNPWARTGQQSDLGVLGMPRDLSPFPCWATARLALGKR